MTTLDPNDGYATLINTFQVHPEDAERPLDVLREASSTMQGMPGFASANLHVTDDRPRVINYVQWSPQADFEAMLRAPRVQPPMRAAADLALGYEPALYALRHSDGALVP